MALRLTPCVAALCTAGLWQQPVSAQQIIPDGRTATTLQTHSNVTDVMTATQRGANAFNSFVRFDVNAGNIANLHVPSTASNLINIVSGSASSIDGVLNAVKNGQIGGNVWFANPHGMVVGASGVVNVGSLHVSTPTPAFVDNFFTAPGTPNDASVSQLLSGEAPRNAEGVITIDGKVNAVDGVGLSAGAVNVGGAIYSGARFVSSTPQFSDVVNANGMAAATRVVERGGKILIVADNDVAISGVLNVDGSAGVQAGDVTVRAGGNLDLKAGAVVSARGSGTHSDGGTALLWADKSAVAGAGALVDASAGNSGSGGNVEFSARHTVELAGAEFRADGRGGAAGQVLIDPAEIIVSANILRSAPGYGTLPDGGTVAGADLSLVASESVTVNANIVVSSRMVGSANVADHTSGASTGDSGDITVEAPSITLKSGSQVLAQGNNGHAGGTVTLSAVSNSIVDILGYKEAQSHIQIGDDAGGATIKGAKVVIEASATADNEFLYPASATDNTISVVTKSLDGVASLAAKALGIDAVYSEAKAVADITVKSGSLIEVEGLADLRAQTTTRAGARPLNVLGSVIPLAVASPVAVGALYARVEGRATVQVDSGATIKATDLTVRAHNDAKLDASINATPKDLTNDSPQSWSVALGITEAEVQSRASVAGTLNVSGKVQVAATNEGKYSNSVESKTGANGRAAAAVAISNHVSGATAELNASVPDATTVEVFAINDVANDSTAAKTTTGEEPPEPGIVDKLKTSVATGVKKQLHDWLGFEFLKPKDEAAANPSEPTQVKFRLAGAVAYADSVANANASIGGGTTVHATDSIAVGARVNAQDTQISAESASTSNSSQTPSNSDTSQQAYSVGIAVGDFAHNALAHVGAGVTLTAPRIGVAAETILPVRDSLLFSGKPLDRWLDLSSITAALESKANIGSIFDVFNGVSAAKAKSDESDDSIAVSGSASILTFTHSSQAVVDAGAHLNVSGDQTGDWKTDPIQLTEAVAAKSLFGIEYAAAKPAKTMRFAFDAPVDLKATNDTTLLFLGGPVLPTGSGEKGLGLALNDIDVVSRVDAIVREGVVVQGVDETAGDGAAGTRTWTVSATRATDEVQVNAKNDDKVISLTSTSGSGATFGVNGSVSILTVDTTTRASVDNEAGIAADLLTVHAGASPVLWSLSGGINLSKGASVGVGIAVNDVTGDTRADISDNDSYSIDDTARASALDIATWSALNTSGAKIAAPQVDVVARTGGSVNAIAVTGSVANQTDEPEESGFFDGIKSKYDKLVLKVEELVGLDPKKVKKTSGSITAGPPEKPKFGLAAAGSASVNTTDMSTAAVVDGVYIDQAKPTDYSDVQSLVVRGISDSDITTATGAAAVSRANSSTQTSAAGIAGSVAVNQIGNANQAILRNSTLVNTDDVTVQALSGGEQLSVAIGAAVDISKGANVRNKTSIVGSLSLTLAQTDDATGATKNLTRAMVENTSITGDAAATARAVEVTAYNRTFIGTGGGSLSVQATGGTGKGTSVGGAVTYSDIRNDVDSRIVNSTVSAVDAVNVNAYNATEIGAGAAMGGFSAVQKSNSIAGAFVITEVTNHTTASIDGGSSVSASSAIAVRANDQGADDALETLIDPDGKRANTLAGLDYCGGDAGAGLTPSGNCITSVAGVLQLTRGSNVGVSASYNLIENNLTAQVENATLTVTGAGGVIDVKSSSSADMIGLALGIGASQKFSGAGSVSIGEIHNTVSASASQSTTAPAATSLKADTITIEAKDASTINTVAGQLVVSTQSSAIGAAVTYNDIRNTVSARADGSALSAREAVRIASENMAIIQSLAVAGGVANGAALSASLSLNFIENTTTSHTSAIFDDQDGDTNTNLVTVKADDGSTIESLAGSVAIGKSAGAGGAFAWNQIDNEVGALVDNAVVHRAAVFDVLASETSAISSLSGAASGGQTLAFSGSVSINHIGQKDNADPELEGNVTRAVVSNTTFDNAAVAVNVKAADKTEIDSLAGSVAVSLGTAAVGGAVADNAIRNVAKASVIGSTLKGAASLTVEGENDSSIDSLSAAAAGAATGAAAGSASSNRTNNRTVGEIVDSAITGSSADVGVSALDGATIRSLSGAAAVAGTGGVGAAVSVNKIDNTTDARVSGVKAATNGYEVARLEVKGDSTATIKTLAAGLGGGASVGAAGSAAINLIGSNTRAHIDGGAKVTGSGSVGVVAESDDNIEVAAGAAGVGATGVGVAASTAVNRITGTTEAFISGSATEVNARANTGAGIDVDTGTLQDIAGGPFASNELAALRQSETVQGLAVNASSTHQVRTTAVNVAVGAYAGVGATANINVIGGETKAYIDAARINGGDNSTAGAAQQVQVKASDHAYASTFVGGVSGGAAGVGAAADVNVFDRNTLASVVGSTVDARDRTEIGAWSTQGVSSLVVGLGGGGFAAVGTGVLAKFTSQTEAWTSGAVFNTATLDVTADHDTDMALSAGAVALGGVAVAGTFAVGLDNSVTKAHIDGGSVDASGLITVKADSHTELKNIGVSGAGAGGVAVAGMAVVALIGNTTQAYATGTRIGSDTTPSGGLSVTAKDAVIVDNKAGAAAGGGSAGIGLGAGVTKVANTVSAYIADSNVDVANSVVVDATATRDLYTFAATAGVSAGFSLAGAAGVTIVGSTLSDEAKNELGSSTDSDLNSFATKDRLSSGGNIDTNDNFSQSDIDGINAAGKTSTSSNLATSGLEPGTLAQRTKAQISGGAANHVTAGTDVTVHASELDRAAMQVGSVSVGAVALGGSVGFLDITNNVESGLSGALSVTSTSGQIAVTSEVGKLDAAKTAADVQTLQGSGGVVGLGAAVSKVTVTNNVASTIGRGTTTQSLNGDITVKATDTSDINSQAVGLNVGLVGAGVTIATADKKGSTSASVGDTAAAGAATQVRLGDATLLVQAQRSGRVSADATAGAGGILAGSGADTTATDSGLVQALVGNAVVVDSGGGKVMVSATATPQTSAEALGVNVGAGAVGASLATARSNATVSAALGAGADITAAQLDVLAVRSIEGAVPSALANATGASGGLLLGANATLAKADSAGITRAWIGDNSTLRVSGATTVKADGNSQQTSSGLGFSFGFIALGADYSRATSNTLTEAILAGGVKVEGGSLRVLATGSDANYAYGLAGSGGVASAPFSEVTTTNTSRTFASTGSGNNIDDLNGNARKIDVGTLEVSANHDAHFDAWIDSTNASLLGASGAKASNSANAMSKASIGMNAYVEADNITLKANNVVSKSGPGSSKIPGLDRSVPGWNVNSSSGGLADVPAAGSTTTITTNALVDVGTNAHLEQTGDRKAPGIFVVDVMNTVNARDRVTMSSGGAVSAASGKSAILADENNAMVSVGNMATVSSVGDIVMGARSVADISTQTAVDVYGLVGVAPFGESISRFTSRETIDIASMADVNSMRDIRLWAGDNNLQVKARSDVFNNTAIPANRDPVADALVRSDSLIDIHSDANLTAVRDIYLLAEKGTASASGVGIGKDIYRETLAAIASAVSNFFGGGDVSFETRTGRSVKTQSAGVVVDGNVLVGTQRNQFLVLDVDTSIDPGNLNTWNYKTTLKTDGFAALTDVTKGIAQNINDRIKYLRDLADQYAGSAGALAYLAEIAFLEQKLVSLGLATKNANGDVILGSGGGTGQSEKAVAQSLRAQFVQIRDYTQTTELPPVVADLATAEGNLTTANTNLDYFDARLTALTSWSQELAKPADQQSAGVITAAKASVFAAENSLSGAAVTGWVRQCADATCAVAPNAGSGSSERTAFNSNVVAPALQSRDGLLAQKTSLDNKVTDAETSIANLDLKIAGDPNATPDPIPPLSDTPILGPTAKFITVPDITAQLGSVHVRGDTFTGGGAVEVPGDARVSITNNTPGYLIINDITIDAESAKLTFNGVDVQSLTDINRLNKRGEARFTSLIAGGASAAPPEVLITSNFEPDRPVVVQNGKTVGGAAPDIQLVGDISNGRGLVRVASKAGSILSQGSIYAGTVDVRADNGDFVHSYSDDVADSFFHTAGDPRNIYNTAVANPSRLSPLNPGGILANGSVFIAARHLNINGLVQSGIANFNVVLPAGGATLTGSASRLGVNANLLPGLKDAFGLGGSATPTLTNDAGYAVIYNIVKDRLEISEANAVLYAATPQGKTNNPEGTFTLVDDYGNIGVQLDTATNRYVVNGTGVAGGYIQLVGQIMNTASPSARTGTGELRVLDGYGQINITNLSGRDVELGRLDAGRGIAGVVDITDIQYIDGNQIAHSIKSTITRENGHVKFMQQGRWAIGGDGLPTIFDENWTSVSLTSSVAGAAGFSGPQVSGREGASATYTPQPGLAYVYETGSDASIKEYYSYSGRNFLGLIDLGGNVDQYRVGPPVRVQPEKPLDDGNYVTTRNPLGAPYHVGPTLQKIELDTSKPPTLVVTKDYSVCDPWFCITQKYYKDWNLTTPIKTIDRHVMKADNPIKVTFIGEDSGTINVNSASNVLLTGQVSNKSGVTTIVAGNSGTGVVAVNKNIVQADDTALISSNSLTLLASGSVGVPDGAGTAAGPDLQGALRLAVTGTVQAAAADGNVLLHQTTGNLNLGVVSAGGDASSMRGRVVLQSDSDIDAASPASIVQGNSVELYSDNGAIGALASPLKINVGFSADPMLRRYYGLKASAQGDIGIESLVWAQNTGGHLLVNSVTTAPTGDVSLTAAGAIIDNNPFATTDTRTQAELAALWDELRLRGPLALDKANDAVAAFENGKNNRYQLYWQLRKRQPDGGAAYDPGYQFVVTDAERDALLASGLDNDQIANFAANRTAQYRELHAEVGGFTASYQGPVFDRNGVLTNPGFRYDASVATGTGEETNIRKGSSWSDSQLALSVGAGLLKNITDTVTTIKQPNVKGRNISLVAGSDIGSFDAPLVINLFDHLALANKNTRTEAEEAELVAQKAALAAAERGDATSDALNVITILQPRPFNLVTDITTGAGALLANAISGFALIGSEQDLWIDQVRASGDIRIKTAGSLVNASSTSAPNVIGHSMILEAANGGIGSLPVAPVPPSEFSTGEVTNMLRIRAGGGVIARAASDIWLLAEDSLLVDTMFSRSNIRLESAASILDFHDGESLISPGLNLRSNNLSLLTQTGSIGSLSNPLDAGVNPDGHITARTASFGQGVYLNGPAGESFNIGSVESGDAINLSSATTMKIDGLVTGPGPISLVSGAAMTLTSLADVHATILGVFLRAGSLTMDDAGDGVNAARMRVDVGTIDIETRGDALITGIETGNGTESAIRVVSTEGHILDNGDTRLDIIADTPPSALLTIYGALGIGDDPLDVRLLNLQAESGGVVDLAVQDSVNIVSLKSADRVWLTAGGNITGNSVIATGTGSHPDQSVSITSTGRGVNLASVSGTSGVAVMGMGDVTVGTLHVGDKLELAGRNVSATVQGTGGPITGSVTGPGGTLADNIALVLSNPAGFRFQDVLTRVGSIDILDGVFAVDNFVVSNFATVTNPQTRVLIDQINRWLQPSDIQLYTGGAGFNFNLDANHLMTNALTVFRSPLHDVLTPDGAPNTSAVEEGYNNLVRSFTLVPSASQDTAPVASVLITYFGNPVALGGNARDGTCQAKPDLSECEE